MTHHNQTVKNQEQKKNLESSQREETHHMQRMPIKLTVGFSSEVMEARRQWDDIFITLGKEKVINQEFYILQK